MLRPLHHPLQHEHGHLRLGIPHGQRRQEVRRDVDRLVGEEAPLVPVVHGAGDEHEGLAGGVCAVERGLVEGRGVRGRGAPGVLLAIDHGQAWVCEVEAAVLVDGGDVGRGGDIEGFDADDAGVF